MSFLNPEMRCERGLGRPIGDIPVESISGRDGEGICGRGDSLLFLRFLLFCRLWVTGKDFYWMEKRKRKSKRFGVMSVGEGVLGGMAL